MAMRCDDNSANHSAKQQTITMHSETERKDEKGQKQITWHPCPSMQSCVELHQAPLHTATPLSLPPSFLLAPFSHHRLITSDLQSPTSINPSSPFSTPPSIVLSLSQPQQWTSQEEATKLQASRSQMKLSDEACTRATC